MEKRREDLVPQYVPKRYAKDYWGFKGSQQYAMFVALTTGIKPLMDDWISAEEYVPFAQMCEGYGLEVEPVVVFSPVKGRKEKIIGSENITTTYFSAERFTGKNKEGKVHLLISKSKDRLQEAKRYAWYFLITNGRSINKPFVNHLIFGRHLGYPACCVDFFRKYNHWRHFSHPYETFRHTLHREDGPVGSSHCNNFLMDSTYSFIHHLPCSYRCESTISLAKALENEMDRVEPDFVKQATSLLRKPLLVFGEKHFILFDGRLKKTRGAQRIFYDSYQYFSNESRPEENVSFLADLDKGDCIAMDEKSLAIEEEGMTLKRIERKPTWFFIDFD